MGSDFYPRWLENCLYVESGASKAPSNSMATLLAALTSLTRECQAAATSFSDEHAAQGLAIVDELRITFCRVQLRPPRYKRLLGCCSFPPSFCPRSCLA